MTSSYLPRGKTQDGLRSHFFAFLKLLFFALLLIYVTLEHDVGAIFHLP